MKTYIPKKDAIQRKWFIIDANGAVLGRLASKVAHVLRGKHKPQFTTHLDVGDHVVIVNADKVRMTGKKSKSKTYTRYTGYPGGLRLTAFDRAIKEKPEWIIEHAVKGMLPHNPLGRSMFRKLKVYRGTQHPHQAQQPEPLPL